MSPRLLTGSRFNLSDLGLSSAVGEDLIDPSGGDAGQVGDFLGIDTLFMKGDDELTALLVKPAWAWNPKHAGVIFLDILEQFLGQNLSRVGVSFHLSVSTFFNHGCETSGL
jgi:hypothetical protein